MVAILPKLSNYEKAESTALSGYVYIWIASALTLIRALTNAGKGLLMKLSILLTTVYSFLEIRSVHSLKRFSAVFCGSFWKA